MELPKWVSKAQAVTDLGIPECVFEDLVQAGLIPAGTKLGHRTLRWRREYIQASGVLLEQLLSALERLSRSDDVPHKG